MKSLSPDLKLLRSSQRQIKRMKKAWKDLGLEVDVVGHYCTITFNCVPGNHSRVFKIGRAHV
jgi:hypothetical protein